jgi:hypothetical protein
MSTIDQLADERDKLRVKLKQAKAKLKEANQRIARLESAGKNIIKAERDADLSAIDHAIGEFERVMEAKP